MGNKKLKRRFTLILVLFTVSVTALWIVYHNIVSSYVGRTMNEAVLLSKSNLLTELSDKFSRLKVAVTIIGGSIYVQEFLAETDVNAYYEKADAVSEIIHKTIYPVTGGDSVYTVSKDGSFFRFTGGISSDDFEKIFDNVIGSATVYTVAEIGGANWFCLSSPVYSRDSVAPIGHIVVFSNMNNTRRALTNLDTMTGIDTAVIADGVILFSSNPALDGMSAGELERQYASVITEKVEGSNMYVAAVITGDALYSGRRLLLVIFAAVTALLLGIFALLYKMLSAKMVSPMLLDSDNMRMGLLKTQIDAHFVVNTIACIEGLARQDISENSEKIALAAHNLGLMLRAKYNPDDEIGVFEQMEDAERYIEIMNIRSDDKFKVEMDVSDELFRCRMLVQVLQPIVENALTHGLGNKEKDCRLNITGRLENDCVLFEISDNGTGMETAAINSLQQTLNTADEWDYEQYGLKGIALVNIQRRIRTRYGEKYGLTFGGKHGEGLTVTVRLPII